MMNYINRELQTKLTESLKPNRASILLGPRRVGKSILIKQIVGSLGIKHLLLNGENPAVQEEFKNRNLSNLKRLIGNNELLVIDEAQKIPQMGQIAKFIIDEIDGIKIMLTGSSAYDINNEFGEPLTGRKRTFSLYPFSENELLDANGYITLKDNLENRLIYGNYPEVSKIDSNTEKREYLDDLVSSYLLKDILAFDSIRNSSKIFDLLRLIAFQIGNEVSYNEIATKLSISKNTVERYLDLLSKVFIIFRLGGYSNNLRKEITKSQKWYFFDTGVRNTIIANLNPISLRNDIGQIWENYVISERVKRQSYNKILSNNFFWRTYDKQEIDWLEERDGNLFAYEIKWSDRKKPKKPAAFAKAYPDSKFKVITPQNYHDFIFADNI